MGVQTVLEKPDIFFPLSNQSVTKSQLNGGVYESERAKERITKKKRKLTIIKPVLKK